MAVLVLLAGPAPLHAADDKTPSGTENKTCGKRIVVKGIPHTFESVASFSAARIWAQTTEERDGAKYAMWHNASRKQIKCAFVHDSKFIVCHAKAVPCKAHEPPGKTAEKTE